MKKTVLITGASSGIGLELARLFAKDGYNLVLVARRKEQLEKLADELSKDYHPIITVITKDLSDQDSPQEIFDELKMKSIRIDILLNNAGTQIFAEFQNIDIDRQLKLIQTNLTSLTHLTHLFLPDMIKQGYGKILNIGSIGSFAPGPLNAVYCASKAYVLSFSEAIAVDLKGTGVTVTALCPGATRTEFAEKAKMLNTNLFKTMVMDSKTVAKAGYLALMKGKRTVIPGIYNKVVVGSIRFIPRWLALRVSKMLMS